MQYRPGHSSTLSPVRADPADPTSMGEPQSAVTGPCLPTHPNTDANRCLNTPTTCGCRSHRLRLETRRTKSERWSRRRGAGQSRGSGEGATQHPATTMTGGGGGAARRCLYIWSVSCHHASRRNVQKTTLKRVWRS